MIADFIDTLWRQGGPAALIVAIALAGNYLRQAIREWRSDRRDDTRVEAADSATTQSTLMDLLRTERRQNVAKDKRIDELEAEVGTLRDQMYAQRDDYETKLNELRGKVRELMFQIEDLQHRLRPLDDH